MCQNRQARQANRRAAPPPAAWHPPTPLPLTGLARRSPFSVKQGVSKCSWGAGLFVCHHADDHRVLSAFPKPQTLCNSLETHAPKGKSIFEKIKSNRGNTLTVQGARLRAFLRLCLRDAAHAWTSASPHSPLTATEERAERPRLARALFVPNRIRKIEHRRFIECRSRASKVY